jgi:riboflavin synthase
MFTGIIEHVGKVEAVSARGGSALLRIDIGKLAEGEENGHSIAVEGVCLTVAKLEGAVASFDASAETLERSTLGELRRGGAVNLERAMRADSRLGGHFVQGHVDGVGVIRKFAASGENRVLEIEVPDKLISQMVEKGSVAVDGISLTVAGIRGPCFTVAIIPHTFENTTLKGKAAGSRVNIELDVLGKYVRKALGLDGGITPEFLRKHGF